MSLIEVLFCYRGMVVLNGRDRADMWLFDTCDDTICPDIQSAVNDDGRFIDADGNVFKMSDWLSTADTMG